MFSKPAEIMCEANGEDETVGQAGERALRGEESASQRSLEVLLRDGTAWVDEQGGESIVRALIDSRTVMKEGHSEENGE